ncbi:MAG TPA: DUF4249 domain-containing protein, partial [Segetibacter sp.]
MEPLIVVDAQIENGQPPYVQLTNSINYFSTVSKEILSGIFIRNAQVTVSDGTSTHKLKEYAVPIGGGFNIYYYSIDSTNLSTAIIGKFNKKYTLRVEVNNKIYTSETTIPSLTKTLDSLWWKPAPQNADTTKVIIMSRIYDPPGYGNYVRYFTKVNTGNFLPGYTSAYDDQVIDGKTYDIQVDQGVDRNKPAEPEDYGFFERGDTATIKFCNIDKATYDFWRTVEYGYQSVGNPFSSPIKILGNISNGALGAFC